MIMNGVIVIQGGRLGLSIVRSLGARGIRPVVIYQSVNEIAINSKYCSEKIKIASYAAKEAILDVLMLNKSKWRGFLVIPGCDEALYALSFYKKELSEYYVLPVPDLETVEKILDKRKTYELADKLGIPRPQTFYPENPEEIKEIKDQLRYPCILKPYERSRFYAAFKEKLFQIHNSEELIRYYRLCHSKKIDVMISEVVPGPDSELYGYICYVTKDGKSLGHYVGRKLRQAPPSFGVGRVNMSCHDARVVSQAEVLLGGLPGFVGIAAVEFKYDPRDDKYKLMEINGRFPLSILLGTKLGINFPYLMYLDWLKNKTDPVPDYEDKVFWIDLFSDFIYTVSALRKHEHLEIRQILEPYFAKKVFLIENFRDPIPMVVHWLGNIDRITARLLPRIKNGTGLD